VCALEHYSHYTLVIFNLMFIFGTIIARVMHGLMVGVKFGVSSNCYLKWSWNFENCVEMFNLTDVTAAAT